MYGDDAAKEQMIKQLKKLVNVKMVKLLSKESSVIRELMLIKVKNDRKTKNDIMTAVSIFRSKIIDYSANALCIEVTGDTEKLDAFIEIMKPLGIIEMCRTGIVALERGEGSPVSYTHLSADTSADQMRRRYTRLSATRPRLSRRGRDRRRDTLPSDRNISVPFSSPPPSFAAPPPVSSR